MERDMENTLFVGCYIGAAFCVALAYQVGKNGVKKRVDAAFDSGRRLGQVERLTDSDPSGADSEKPSVPKETE